MEKKRSLLTIFLSLISINFVSAYIGSGSFSFRDLFYSVDQQSLVLITVFFIFLALINFLLRKGVFKEQKATAGIISFGLALLITYFMEKKYTISQGIYGIGIPENLLTIIIIIVLIFGATWIIRKTKLHGFFLILGLLFIIISFTDWIYQKGALLILGIVLLLVGLWRYSIYRKRRKIEKTIRGGKKYEQKLIGKREKELLKKEIKEKIKMDKEYNRQLRKQQRKNKNTSTQPYSRTKIGFRK